MYFKIPVLKQPYRIDEPYDPLAHLPNPYTPVGQIEHVTCANPSFNFENLLMQSIAREDPYDPLFSLSPLSTPPSTPLGSPHPSAAPLPPADGPAQRQQPPSAPTESRLAKKKKKGHKNRRNRRDKVKQQQSFGDYAVREEAKAKYVNYDEPIAAYNSLRSAKVASSGFVGLNSQRSSRQSSKKQYTLEEMVGEGSEFNFKLVEWDGITTKAIVDGDGRIIGVLAGRPNDPKWDAVHQNGANLLEGNRARLRVRPEDFDHRRGPFVALRFGVSHGGGQEQPSNLRNNKTNAAVLEELRISEPFRRLAGFGSAVMATWFPKLYKFYVSELGSLHKEDQTLTRLFNNSVFSAASVNFGPETVCYDHTDRANLPFGQCPVSSMGSYDPKKGGHLILWDCHLVIEFPPGSTILIPSAIIAHSNTKIQKGETRYSFTQYSAGGLFRWVENGFMKNATYEASLTPEQLQIHHAKNAVRWGFGLSLFPKIADADEADLESEDSF